MKWNIDTCEDEGSKVIIPTTIPELSNWIEERLASIPDGRKKKIFAQWRFEINQLIKDCNERAGFIMYKLR